jgi:serine protease inhibitor
MRRTLSWIVVGLLLCLPGCSRQSSNTPAPKRSAATSAVDSRQPQPDDLAAGPIEPEIVPKPPPVRLTHVLVESATLQGYDAATRKDYFLNLPAQTKVAVNYLGGGTSYVTTEQGYVGQVATSRLREVWRVPLPFDAFAIARANNQFGCDLYGQLRGTEGNFFFSPLSIHIALAMTWAGASGPNEADMARTLHLSLPQPHLHGAYDVLQRALVHDEQVSGYSLSVANRLWGQASYQFVPEFLETTRRHYGAGLLPVDFARPAEAAATINAWIEKETRDKIKNLVPPESIDPEYTRLMLTNAVYFKADWTEPFEEQLTRLGSFHLLSGESIEVPLMHKTESFHFRHADGFKLLEMPYGQQQISMLLLLPDANDGLAALEAQLTEENLRAWPADLRRESVEVTLPRFKLESSFSLKENLSKLGMARAFEQHPDNFLGITTETPQWLSDVLHKAYVDVNEKGTEAAAATAVLAAAGGIPPPPPQFIADHPFVFLIRDNLSGAILFFGRVVDPRGN